ncbi:MAG: hypothetical protein LBM98_13100 [Oscillospiraceae bacterium]|nr:hypothetical protein [Oscillospiraceae bacterium]
MLRTCNALRIASVPVLRNDGGGRVSNPPLHAYCNTPATPRIDCLAR